MERKKSLVIVDDHPLFLEGIKSILKEEKDLCIIGETDNCSEAIELINDKNPDVALLDIEIKEGSGFKIVENISLKKSNTKFIFLTMYNDIDILNKALNIGVKGFILKEHTSSEIVNCIRSVISGKTYISPLLSDVMMKIMKINLANDELTGLLNKLSVSERKILKLISLNKTSKEIGSELNISPKTVENHRNNICEKLNLHGTHSLLKFAIENKERL